MKTGEIIWYKYNRGIGDGARDITSVVATNDGGFMVTKILQAGEQIDNIAINTKGYDGIIEKFNSEGDLEWYKQFSGTNGGIDNIRSIVETKDGGFLTEVFFSYEITLENGKTLKESEGQLILLKYNKDGKLEKYKQVYENKYGDKRTVLETQDGGIIYAFR